ncbi:MAG TPA: alanine:cation symporter family protein, partial [Methanosarcinales archaeon]|nr:alanine:cation symporter family protein [Methanosarcinales archaeon]
AIALMFFTFTTILAYAFYTDSNIAYLFRNSSNNGAFKLTQTASRAILCIMVFIGAVSSADIVWNFGSAGVGAMAWFNVIAILLLTKPAIATLKDYEAQKKLGINPIFIPSKLGIKDAEIWDTIIPKNYPKELAAYNAAMKNKK